MSNKVEIHKSICEQMNNLYATKNADYGDSFAQLRQKFGNTAILIRLYDKLNRLEKLMTKGDQQVKDESIEDTLKDLANYSIMELVERKVDKEFEESLRTEACESESDK